MEEYRFSHSRLNYLFYIFLVIFQFQYASARIRDTDLRFLKSSLTFVIDDTSSMQNDIDAVKLGSNAIFDTVMSNNASQIENFLLITFNDDGFESDNVKLRADTKERDVFKNALSAINVDGGGDCPEYSIAGIRKGLEASLPRSDIYVFTDATAKDYKDEEEIITLAQSKQCRIIFVLTGDCDLTPEQKKTDRSYQVYYTTANATDGEVFNLEKGEVGKILEYVKRLVKQRTFTIAKKTLPPGKHNFTFTTDVIMGELTLSLSSVADDDPTVDITAPDGTDVWKKILFETSQIKVYSIDVTMPGVHTVNVANKEETRAKVTAESGIDFLHGFSKLKLSSIVDTSSRPAPGVKSHLSIKLNEGDIELKSIQLLDMDDKVITNMPLHLVDKKTKFYSTKAFNPPNTMFKVMIVGYDPKSNTTITRAASTPVEPQKLPKDSTIIKLKPTVTIEGDLTIKARYDETLLLVCKINGYPKPDVVWRNKNSGRVETGEESVLELPYDYLNILTIPNAKVNATYECEAINSLGKDVKELKVGITNKFNIVKTPSEVKIEYGKDGKVECIVDAYPPANITWYKNEIELKSNDHIKISSDKSTLTIKNARRSDRGKYLCQIVNPHRTIYLSKRVIITGLEAPEIDRSSPQEVSVKKDFSVDLECRVLKGNPKPTISWYYVPGSAEMVEKLEWENKEIVTVYKANALDSGKYVCRVDNEISSDYIEISLLVEYKPTIDIPKKSIKEKSGREVTIPCIVNGGPEPKVTWFKDGEELKEDSRIHIYRDSTIKFKARSSDSGIYKCTATNKLGTVSGLVKVDISSPIHINPPFESKLMVMKGGGIVLPCEASGHPKPKIHWVYHSFNTSALLTKTMTAKVNGLLHLTHVKSTDQGFYTCVATNAAGSSNITYEVIVFETAQIINKRPSNRFEVIEGDQALRLTCEATGNPKPTITWSKDGLNLASGSTYYMEGGLLIIRNVPKSAQGTYECHADNFVGTDDDEYIVTVHKYPSSHDIPTTAILVEQGKPAQIDCTVPHKLIDQLNWYKKGKLIHKGEFTIESVTLEDAGLYTCRVSNMFKSESANVMVTVGQPPKFTTEEDTDVEMAEGMSLSCEHVGIPKTNVTWYRDDRKISWTAPDYYFGISENNPGKYRCDVQNALGNISRTFDVTPRDCFVDIDKLTKLQPLVVNAEASWPRFENLDKFVVFMKGEQLILFCPHKFKMFPSQYVYAFCDGRNKFTVNGKIYDYSDIQCTEEVKHIVQRTGRRCLPGDTEHIKITYKEIAMYGDRGVYDICWNKTNESPIYAHHILQNSMEHSDHESRWLDEDKLTTNYLEAYDCDKQINTISSWLGRWFHDDDKCCFSRRQLVNPRDVFPGIPQKATFSYYNVVPHWSTCNAENWEEIEHRVRTFARNSYSDLIVWTGTAKELVMPSKRGPTSNFFTTRHTVPLFLWKVIQDPASMRSLAIIQVNVPDLKPSEVSKYILCEDVCNRVDWMKNSKWRDSKRGYTYCCNLEDFTKKFGYRNVFIPGMESLLTSDAFVLPESSLTV